MPAQDSFDAQVAQIRKFLKERIFVEENLESSDSFSATFRVPGSAICSDGTTAADPACVSQVARFPPRELWARRAARRGS